MYSKLVPLTTKIRQARTAQRSADSCTSVLNETECEEKIGKTAKGEDTAHTVSCAPSINKISGRTQNSCSNSPSAQRPFLYVGSLIPVSLLFRSLSALYLCSDWLVRFQASLGLYISTNTPPDSDNRRGGSCTQRFER